VFETRFDISVREFGPGTDETVRAKFMEGLLGALER